MQTVPAGALPQTFTPCSVCPLSAQIHLGYPGCIPGEITSTTEPSMGFGVEFNTKYRVFYHEKLLLKVQISSLRKGCQSPRSKEGVDAGAELIHSPAHSVPR